MIKLFLLISLACFLNCGTEIWENGMQCDKMVIINKHLYGENAEQFEYVISVENTPDIILRSNTEFDVGDTLIFVKKQ